MPPEPIRTSIVIPAYNEARRLPNTLEVLRRRLELDPAITEILIVDDGSKDETAAIVRDFARTHSGFGLVSYWPNAGKGYAIRRGVLEAKGDQILLTDADLSTPIEEMDKLVRALENHEVAIGSRGLDATTVKRRQRWYRQTMGKTFNWLMRRLTGLTYADTQCGFKLFRREAARKIFSEAVVDRFAYDVEMLMIARRHGYAVAEVPVLWFNDEDSRVNLIRDSTRMLLDVLAIRRRIGKADPASS